MFASARPHQRPMMRLLIKAMPPGFRRLILLSSLIAFLTNTHKPEKAFIRNMDDALQLSRGSNPSGLEFPVRLSRVFWGNQQVFRDEIAILLDAKSTEQDMETAASKVVDIVPPWFAYDTPKKITEDLVRFFSQYRQTAVAA